MIVKNASLARSTTPASKASSKATTPGPVGQRPDELGLQRPAVGGSDGRRRVDQYVASHIAGERIVGGIGGAQYLCAEIVEAQVGPRRSTPCVLRERQRSCRIVLL